ncbi:MAG: Threonylcarbamoyladenosine tRNA methylthiotransferase MtaB [Chlamydiae bacterium]|nr:Threonylcarbamoyladenosine tRNA methylthiotransferase MtaB [Chlamydiota bacterium]
MKKYKVVTLGCRTNQYESQALSDQLRKKGYVQAQPDERAEICIVNTCTVTRSADKRSLTQIRKLAREHNPEKLIVTGCYAERLGDVSGVTHVVKNSDKEALLPLIFPEEEWPEFRIERFEAHTRAFVKIQDGCNSYCSYCVIPSVRGRSRSKKLFDILQEVETLVENGYREVVLTGINIGDFDGNQTPPVRLADLVRQVDQVEGLDRLRISSIDPDEVDDDLLDAVINGKKTCPSMHIVLQAGSNLTLKRMRRKYTKQDFLEATARLTNHNPDFTFTTDVIVGFPGESEEDFQETLDLIREIKFAKVHMFPYSDRPKTRASRMPNKVTKEVIEERKHRLLEVAEREAFQLRNKFVGREVDVLLESKDRGHTEHFLSVSIPTAGLRPNEIVRVRCNENHRDGLIGHYENQTDRKVQTLLA